MAVFNRDSVDRGQDPEVGIPPFNWSLKKFAMYVLVLEPVAPGHLFVLRGTGSQDRHYMNFFFRDQ